MPEDLLLARQKAMALLSAMAQVRLTSLQGRASPNTPADAQKALEQIEAVTDKPVETIVLTHGDPDHFGGLSGYSGARRSSPTRTRER